jgi:resolvase-like protein
VGKVQRAKGTVGVSAQLRGAHPVRSLDGMEPSSAVSCVPAGQPRALVAVRLSDLTVNTTSPARQTEASKSCAAAIGARVIGYATDVDVSASKKTPFERPKLGAWLARPDDYDVIVFRRPDRAVRSVADMSNLAAWARMHNKRLVFAEGPGEGKVSSWSRTPRR